MSNTTFTLDENGLTITFGWVWIVAIVIIIASTLLLTYLGKHRKIKSGLNLKSITTDLGFGSATFEVDHSLRQTAYSIYVELTTRKIALPYDIEKDVIVEVYDSWYASFGIIRDLLRSVNVESIDETFVNDIKKILNEGLRGHLTTWQAKFRSWYKSALTDSKYTDYSPQQIQMDYPMYNELIGDLLKTNKLLMQFADGLHFIVFERED